MYTHKIISMERGQTGGSNSPMWRCQTEDGEKVNIFKHTMPERDTAHLFEAAGYWPFMKDMGVGDQITWNEFPIGVTMQKKGEWWEITSVQSCEDAHPDERLLPNHQDYQRSVIVWARSLLRTPQVVFWDTETSGLSTKQDEILSLGAINLQGEPLINLTLRPVYLERVQRTSEINGLTADDLKDCPDFFDSYPRLYGYLFGAVWATFKADFDSEMLEYACRRAGLTPIFPSATVDVMEMFARFYGDYNQQRQQFKPKTLQFAAEYFGIQPGAAHTALDDARTTLKVVQALANAGAAI